MVNQRRTNGGTGWLYFVLLVAISQPGATHTSDSDEWWQRTVFYQIYPRSFMDSNGDGVGDLRGITSRLVHLKDAGIGATWLSPIFLSPMVDFGYDITDYTAIQPEYGTMEDFEALLAEADRLGIKIILDFVPNHTSDQCEWFQRSVAREAPYTDYYVWHDGREDPSASNGTRLPPNNWQSVFYGSAWTLHPVRGQYYLHQFTAQQPDLNFRNPAVVEEMRDVLRFWLRKGVAGFRIDAVNHLFEVEGFPDEPETGTDRDPLSYGFTHHIYTKDLLEDYDMVYQWRELLDDWTREHGGDSRIIMTEAYANITFTMKYYRSGEEHQPRQGSHMPFNFLLITDLNRDSSAQDFVFTINKWLTYMPRVGATANWVLGNHDQPRVGTRYGAERIDAIHTLLLTLPGIAVTYYGEEIGMIDNPDAISANGQGDSAAGGAGDAFIVFSRDPERTPFQWDETANAGFSTGPTTWLPVHPNYRQLNLAAEKRADRSHYKTYQALVRLRAHETFRKGSIQLVPYSNTIIVYVRELQDSDTFVVVINLAGGIDRTVDLSSVFPRLSPELTVASSGSASRYRAGDIVQSDKLVVGEYEGLVLRGLPLTSRVDEISLSEVKFRSPVMGPFRLVVVIGIVLEGICLASGQSTVSTHPRQDLPTVGSWWESAVLYQLLPRSFRDSDGDGNGDLRGLLERFDHLIELGVTGICLGPVFRSPMRDGGYDVSDFRDIDPMYGTMTDFEELLERAKAAGMKVVLDFVPNHTSEQHEWFQNSVRKNKEYEDYYILREGANRQENKDNGAPPNNWQSLYHGPAWSRNVRGTEFYLHQFGLTEPDLNYRNAKVRQEMEDVMRFWLDRGVDGLRLLQVNHLYEDAQFRDEPFIDPTKATLSYENLDHIHTRDLSENYVLVSDWRILFDEYGSAEVATTADSKLMITSAYTGSVESTMKWFGMANRVGAHIAQNFGLVRGVSSELQAEDLQRVIDGWLNTLPPNGVGNWVLGNHDYRRVASRFGRELAAGLAMLCFSLPGTVFVYYGEEIGMEDNDEITWKETQDPLGCSTNGSVFQQHSRDPARTPFQWDDSNEWAGFSSPSAETKKDPWLPVNANYALLNLAVEKSSNRSMYNLYRELIRWHRQSVTLRYGSYQSFVLPNNVFAVLRSLLGEQEYATVLNVNAHAVTFNLSRVHRYATRARVAFTSPEGTYVVDECMKDVTNIALGAHETVILELSSGATWISRTVSSSRMRFAVSALVLVAVGLLATVSGKSPTIVTGKQNAGMDWWESGVFYQIYPRSFKDSDGDGVGDLTGITDKLDHLADLGVTGVWLSPVFKSPMADFGYDIADFRNVDPIFGTMADLDRMVAKAKQLGIKVILDFVPNHTSDEHEWFIKSVNNEGNYRDYYVWRNGVGTGTPNNWQSVFHTPAWTLLPGQTQYYLHQFDKKQPDLNYRNPLVKQEMADMVKFWLDKGIDGFRIDAINHAYEDPEFRDERLIDPNGELIWENMDHEYTQNLPECYDLIYDWRDLFDQYKAADNVTRLMMTEAYANLEQTMLWYGNGNRKGAHIPFNFAMINRLSKDSRANDFKEIIDEWLEAMPAGAQANWVLGNHDRPRIASRYGRDRASSLAVLEMTLPGIAVVYYGEEIGMEDNRDITFEETQDPQAANTNPEVYQQFTRDPVRTPFQWDATAYAGFTAATAQKTWLPVHPNYREVNLAAQKAANESMFKLYQKLIKLRQEHAFMHGSFESKVLLNNVLGYTRTMDGEQSYAVVVNMNDNDVNVNLQELHEDIESAKVTLTSLDARMKEGEEVTEVFHIILGRYDAVVFEIASSAATIGASMIMLIMATILRTLF
ncbi:uncharacterized protein LOC126565930 [Anopheles maculipalpis]|uniref:uncharacterized protein LOC126565930 n=1 Tax=Anopheles maculipalpis TaxID=1496333 RepID=UPI00215990E9|nr:uncharacterized protein LOC126565930 [Anopheles maculipalpis]